MTRLQHVGPALRHALNVLERPGPPCWATLDILCRAALVRAEGWTHEASLEDLALCCYRRNPAELLAKIVEALRLFETDALVSRLDSNVVGRD